MLSCARSSVSPCSMTCCLYCSAILGWPILSSLITQRGSRSTMKQIPPRYWARCSTARRRRRGPVGPNDNQSESRGKNSSRSEEHTSELQSQSNLVCRLLLEKKKHTYLTSK